MRLQASFAFAAALALGYCRLAWRRRRRRQPLRSRRPEREGPRGLQGEIRYQQGRLRGRGHRDWAPNGADRFYNLVKNGFYDDARFFRVIDGFMVQFGINGDPNIAARVASTPTSRTTRSSRATSAAWSPSPPPGRTRARPRCSSISATMPPLDGQGFSPFGKVVSGMDVVDSLYGGYGEGAPNGNGPDQGRIQQQGNAYLETGVSQARLHQEGDDRAMTRAGTEDRHHGKT